MNQYAHDWAVVSHEGASYPVLLNEQQQASGTMLSIASPTGDLDRSASLTDARVVRLADGVELTLDEQRRTHANGHTAVVLAVAREG